MEAVNDEALPNGFSSLHRQQLQLASPPIPGPAEVAARSLKDVLAGMKGQHQPLSMASLPFRRVYTHCPSVSDSTQPQNSPHALPQAGHLGRQEKAVGFGVTPQWCIWRGWLLLSRQDVAPEVL